MSEPYIPRLTLAKCNAGYSPAPLMINPDHGVLFLSPDLPLLNANDHMPFVNILPYGMCAITGSPCIPKTENLAWKNVNERHIIDGAPALLKCSTLSCLTGGTISIIKSSADEAMEAKRNAENPDHVETIEGAKEPEQNPLTEGWIQEIFCLPKDV